MDTLQYREQELKHQLKELELEKTRSIAPVLYDYLKKNGFVFENKSTAFKPLDDNFEISVAIYGNSIEIWFYDRKKFAANNSGSFTRYEINPPQHFSKDEEDLAISFLNNPPTPQEYEITLSHKVVCYWIGEEKELVEDTLESMNSGWRPELYVDFVKKLS